MTFRIVQIEEEVYKVQIHYTLLGWMDMKYVANYRLHMTRTKTFKTPDEAEQWLVDKYNNNTFEPRVIKEIEL